MKCESCEATVSISSAYRENGDFLCADCYLDGPKRRASAAAGRKHRESHDSGSAAEENKQQRPSGEETRGVERATRLDIAGKTSTVEKRNTDAEPTPPTSQNFKTLLGLGKFIAGAGWLVVVLGIIGIVLGGASLSDGPGGVAAGLAVMLGLVGGFFLSALGLLMVAAGQQISCFVAIERNTRSLMTLLDAREA